MPLVPLMSSMRHAKKWLLRTPGKRACAPPLSACSPVHVLVAEGHEGDDNESLQDSAAAPSPSPPIARSSRLARTSPSNAFGSFDSPSDADVLWEEWAAGGGGGGPLPAVSERQSEDASCRNEPTSAVTRSLTADALALQDAASASESSQSNIADSCLPPISPPVSGRSAQLASGAGS